MSAALWFACAMFMLAGFFLGLVVGSVLCQRRGESLVPRLRRRAERVRDLIGYHAENLWWRLTGRV